MNYNKRNYERAMSLAEICVAIAIISTIIVAMSTFFARGLISVKKNQSLIPGYTLGKSSLEKMRRASYDTIENFYFPLYDDMIKQNGVEFYIHITPTVIYKPHPTYGGNNDGRSLIKINLSIDWDALEGQGRKDLTLETYIYTEPDY